jgi:hypothetical protein
MLCIKPYLLWKEMKGVQREGYSGLPGNEDDNGLRHDGLEDEDEGRVQILLPKLACRLAQESEQFY